MGDIDTVVVDSLKARDLKRPSREADIEPALDEHSRAGQDTPYFGELARLRLDLD